MGRSPAKPPEVPELPASFPEMVDAESMSVLREALDISDEAETTVHVYLFDEESKIDSKIWDGDADAFNLGNLAKVFGSGKYRVKIYARNAEGYKPMRYNRIIAWTLSPEDEARVQAAKLAARNPVLPAAGGGGNGDVREMMREMMAGFQASIAQIMAANKPAPPVDTLGQFTQFAALMKTMMPAPVAAQPDLLSMLGILEKVKAVAGPSEASGLSASEQLLVEAGKVFMPALAAGMVKQQAGDPAPVRQSVAALPAPGATETPLSEEDEQVKVLEQLKVKAFQFQLKAANKAAARGVLPADYADSMYDNFEEDDLHKLATMPNWFELLCELEPGCKDHAKWYAAMRDTVLEYAVEDGVLARDAAGNLTLAPESDTVTASEPAKAANGAPDAATGTTPATK